MRTIQLLLLASTALIATGQVTYIYTGKQFNAVAYWPQSGPAFGSHITAVITLPVALPKSSTTCIASRLTPCSSPVVNLNGFSYELNDGVNFIGNTYPKGASGAILNSLTLTTDGNGNIVNWDVDASIGNYTVLGEPSWGPLELRTANEPPPGFENESDVSSVGLYLASNSANPGSWAVNDPVAPVVTGAAGYGSIAPGGLATIYGNFAGFPTAPGLSATLGGVQVSFPGIINGGAPLLYVSPSQITFQVPWELQQANSSGQTVLSVSLNGTAVTGLLLDSLPPVAPGIFEENAQHQAAALDASYHLIGPANPAAAGSVVSIYCTGLGAVNVPQVDGVPAPASELVYTNATPTVTVGGTQAQIVFSGLAPGTTGLYQIDALVPNVPSGAQTLTVTISNVVSNSTTLTVQ